MYLKLREDSIRPCIDNAIRDISKIWKNYVITCPPTESQKLLNLIGNEYVGNVTINRFKNKRMGLLHRHDTIRELIDHDISHPMLKKLDPTLHNFIKKFNNLNKKKIKEWFL